MKRAWDKYLSQNCWINFENQKKMGQMKWIKVYRNMYPMCRRVSPVFCSRLRKITLAFSGYYCSQCLWKGWRIKVHIVRITYVSTILTTSTNTIADSCLSKQDKTKGEDAGGIFIFRECLLVQPECLVADEGRPRQDHLAKCPRIRQTQSDACRHGSKWSGQSRNGFMLLSNTYVP